MEGMSRVVAPLQLVSPESAAKERLVMGANGFGNLKHKNGLYQRVCGTNKRWSVRPGDRHELDENVA